MYKSIVKAAASLLVLAFSAGATEAQMTAEELVREMETMYIGETSRATATMSITTEAWSRELSMTILSEGREKFLIRITAPAREAGTGTLKIEDEMWNYLPRIDRLIRIPPTLMGDSWMGSHLTNDDLVRDERVEELYDLEITETRGDTVTVQAVPGEDVAVVWGRIDYVVDTSRLVPLRILYYDEIGELMRRIEFDMIRTIGKRQIPMRMTVVPVETPRERTVMTYSQLEFDVNLPPDTFTIRTLRRR